MNTSLLALVREFMAGMLGLTVMIAFFVLLTRALGSLPSGAQASDFVPIKELLAIVNPVVGLIIGYYFSRATSEARAEKAEAAATTANDSARTAQQTAANAQQAKTQSEEEAKKAKNALQSLVGAVEGSRIQSDGEHASTLAPAAAREADVQLRVAMARAKEVLG
jgi:hypothetical protein